MSRLLTIFSRAFSVVIVTGIGVATLAFMAGAYLFFTLSTELPTIEDLNKVKLQIPLRVFSAKGKLIAEFGEKRRSPLKFDQIPANLRNAFISAEDDRFFDHVGFDYQGLVRAVIELVRTGRRGQGGSTITMQLARNLFLTKKKTYKRKVLEIFLAMKIEREFSKKQILQLYLNKIYLGNRSYGVQAAAQVYYGVKVNDLTVAQMAMIAGLPKAPSAYNPIVNPKRALLRRNYVLRRMLALNYIDNVQYDNARKEQVSSSLHALRPTVEAPYVAEMVRQEMKERYGNKAYQDGYSVYTTIRADHQKAAQTALRKTLLEYDRRHGYKGALANRPITEKTTDADKDKIIRDFKKVGGLHPGLVTEIKDKEATIYLGDSVDITIKWDGLKWGRKYIDDNNRGPKPKTAADVLKVGDVVYVEPQNDGQWFLAQKPEVGGAMVSINPRDGAITSLVGGFDFYDSKFNRVIQAKRQPGSSFKPFVYSGALDKGFTPASTFNDAPIVFDDKKLEKAWRPENFEKRVFGPTRMRVALTKSRNLVAIRILKAIGISYAIEYAQKFGFKKEALNRSRNFSLALGSLSVTPLQLASGYTVFANGGFRVRPYFITKIVRDGSGTIFTEEPAVACSECEKNPEQHKKVKVAPRVLSSQVAYQMTSMLRDVVRRGTGTRAYKALKRNDMAGKTGTTNDQQDAWFSGYTSHLVATAWVGFDKIRSMGRSEFGGRAALPMWVRLMRVALKDKPQKLPKMPAKMVTVKIDKKTGLLANRSSANSVDETFREELVPKEEAGSSGSDPYSGQGSGSSGGGSKGGSGGSGTAPEERPLF